jgi:hypothetical protein
LAQQELAHLQQRLEKGMALRLAEGEVMTEVVPQES